MNKWKLVPLKPTEEMIRSGEDAHARCDDAEIYRAMLAASPEPPRYAILGEPEKLKPRRFFDPYDDEDNLPS